jgi:predicted permease
VLLTIALGVGATTTVFSVADALLVRPLPYPGASRVFIAQREFVVEGHRIPASLPLGIVPIWREDARTIEAAAPFNSPYPVQLGNRPDVVPALATNVDRSFLAVAGMHPVIGQNFESDELTPGGPGAILLTEQFWRRQYGGSPSVIGRVVQVDSQPFTIVGVVPASLVVPDFSRPRPDVLLPTQMPRAGSVLVRLKPGVSRQAATAELDQLLKGANLVLPEAAMFPMPMTLHLSRPQDSVEIRPALLMLIGAVALLLLVACTNVASLLLARGAARQRELAVRYALGAGRARLVQQLVTESLVLGVLGGALAVCVGWAGLRLLAALRPAQLVALTHISANRGVVSIAATLAILIGIGIGLVAALRITHRELGPALRVGTSSTAGTGRLRSSLVVGEIALSTMLLVGALLLIHTVVGLQRTSLGFDARGLYTVTFALPETAPPGVRAGFAALVLERAEHVFGTGHVTLGAPPQPHYWRVPGWGIETPEHPGGPGLSEAVAQSVVAPDYFATLRMPLLTGRTFDEGSAARHEAIVSESLARMLWPNESAVGRHFRESARRPDSPVQPWQTVIGVVPDMVQDLIEGGEHLAMYLPPDPTQANGYPTLLVRIEERVGGRHVREFAASVQHGSSEVTIESVRDAIDESMAEPRFLMRILTTFAVLGIVLAAIGLFGVVAYDVGQRTREIGVRMTLGATRGDIAQLVVGNAIRRALLGIGFGLLGAVEATRLIQSLLYGVSRLDPLSFGLGATVLLAAAVLACVVPMLRATSVEPVIAMRSE